MGNNNGTVCNETITVKDSIEHFYNVQGELVGKTSLTECGTPCESWLLLPGENLWNDGARGLIYLIAMAWVFIGIAIASDMFMSSIEVITSKKRTVSIYDAEKECAIEKEVLMWNETVANLTLMALGSSAPEILIALVEAASNLPPDRATAIAQSNKDGLGVFTIMGSASFNLLLITAICIIAPELPKVKKVSLFSVFVMTTLWSLWAYIWMLIVVVVNTPNVVDIWEAVVTLLFFPLLAITAYCQDNNWWCKRKNQGASVSDVNTGNSHANVRILNHDSHHGMLHGPSKELQFIEHEHEQKELRKSQMNLNDIEEGESRHPVVKSRSGSRPTTGTRNSSAKSVRIQAIEQARQLGSPVNEEDMIGKFTFAASSHSVLESSGILEMDVLFHRKKPAAQNGTLSKSKLSNGTTETTLTDAGGGVVGIQWETREGTAKLNRDFKFSSGKLVFNTDECRKTITIPIVNDHQFEPDTDFYVILKNPEGDSGLGDPSVTRVTIIDDDEPGEFSFTKQHYYVDRETCTLMVERRRGCDGQIDIQYSTVDGTAKGGESLEGNDYVVTNGTLEFKHGETSKPIVIECASSKKMKNFIVTIRTSSLGAKIGSHSAAVVNLSENEDDGLEDRLADILADDDDLPATWGSNFRDALTIEADEGEELNCLDYFIHFVAMPWKLVCAITPPTHWLSGFPAFIVSLGLIAFMSALVEQLAFLLGCVIGLETAVCGISLVAFGTSVPDTFASRLAAKQDEYADAAIGNITGSNSVNVFLGLGLPWVLQSMYYNIKLQLPYTVNSDNLTQAVVLFLIVGICCIIMLFIRRKTVGGELGGPKISAYLCAGLLLLLYIIFIVVISLIVYKIIVWRIPIPGGTN